MVQCRVLPAEHQSLAHSYIQSPERDPLPYSGKISHLEASPVMMSNASPGDLLTTASPMQFVPDSQTRESVTRRLD